MCVYVGMCVYVSVREIDTGLIDGYVQRTWEDATPTRAQKVGRQIRSRWGKALQLSIDQCLSSLRRGVVFGLFLIVVVVFVLVVGNEG